MLLLQAAATLLLLLICMFAPGFFVVRRLRWSAMEKLCGSIALSLIFLWFAGWAIYVCGADPRASYAVTVISFAAGAACWKDVRALFRSSRVRTAVCGFAFLLGWTIVVLSIIRHYSGAGWSGDWLEQFHRCLFYLHRLPKDTLMFGGYPAPARPPMANIICALFLAQMEDRFELFQLIYSSLNLLPFLACCLIAPELGRARRGWMTAITAVFAMSPVFVQNATYSWTKALSAFFVLTAVHFYLAAGRKRDPLRMTASFTVLAAGLLVHYSAAPYCIFLGMLYLVHAWAKRPARWKELGLIAAGVSTVLLPWFAWSFANFGVARTFRSAADTSINYGPAYEGSTVVKIAANIFDSIVPHVLRNPGLMHTFDQPNWLGYVRDNAFIVYQSTMICAMGAAGGVVAIWFLILAVRRRGVGRELGFWLLLVGFIIAVGFAVVGERDYFGLAQLMLVPLLLVGTTWIALHFQSSRLVKLLLMAGLTIDFGLGVVLHARVQHLENTTSRTVFNSPLDTSPPGEYALSQPAFGNWYRKHQLKNSEKWLRDLEAFRPNDPAFEPTRIELRQNLQRAVEDDTTLWKGWYRRHGGEITFLGDHFGDSDVATGLLIALAAVLLWRLGRLPVLPAPVAVPAPRKPRASRAKR